jgi:hypothetical protein
MEEPQFVRDYNLCQHCFGWDLMRRRLLLFAAVLLLVSTFGWFLAPAAGQVEGREQVGGVAPEPPEAADLRGQNARIEKAPPQLPAVLTKRQILGNSFPART